MADISALRTQRGRIKGSVKRSQTFATKVNSETTIEDITARLDKLEELWAAFIDVDDQLVLNEIPSEFDEFEENYFIAKAKLLKAMKSKLPTDTTPPSTPTDQLNSTMIRLFEQQRSVFDSFSQNANGNTLEVRLPKINIPTFNGDYKEWPSFKDLFTSSVHHKASLSNVHKFQYLKSALKDEAASLIKHITITDDNYNEAWQKLNSRYDKKKQILNSYVKSFINQTSVSQASSSSLRKLTDSSDELIRGIKSLGAEATTRDPWLIFLLLSKCDSETRQSWSEETAEIDLPSFDSLIKFLNKRCDALESIEQSPRKPLLRTVRTLHARTMVQCPKCSQPHPLYQCPEFKLMNISTKRSFVQQNSLCFNCLHSGHSAQKCSSKVRCHFCSKLHHSTLHLKESASSVQQTPQQSTINEPSKPREIKLQSSANQGNSTISMFTCRQASTSPVGNSQITSLASSNSTSIQLSLLPTALVNAVDSRGLLQSCRVLIDSGSTASFVTEDCAQRLGLRRSHHRVRVNGLGLSNSGFTKGSISITLCSRLDVSQQITVNALVLPKLTSKLPSNSFDSKDWIFLRNYELADPAFNIPSKIDILLGVDQALYILKDGHHIISPDLPVLQNTIFGHIIAGNISTTLDSSALTSLHADLEDVDQLLQRFWELEEFPPQTSRYSEEEQYCENLFASTHYIDKDTGRYVVHLPLKNNALPLGNTATAAISQLHSVERRLNSKPDLRKEYSNFLKEYEHLKHLEPIPQEFIESSDEHAYLPHHAVLKPSSTTTKLRVVFNGSAKSSSGISLNQKLCVGPKVQPDLYPILLNFRMFKVAVTADIEKMYRQVLVTQAHRNYQRIVWRDNPEEPERHLWLTTVTYGTASAPFLATRALKQLAIEFQGQFPRAENALINSFYVDDLMSGADDEAAALELYRELSTLLQKRGFVLRKWASNSPHFLKGMPDNHSSTPVQIDENSDAIKVLGLMWIQSKDTFTFNVTLPNQLIMTKRKILSDASRIFDPLGLISPTTICCKILLQQIWMAGYQWDEPLSDQIAARWREIAFSLPALQNLQIPRWLRTKHNRYELHGFADASESAYAAVIYCRAISDNDDVSVSLFTSKTKVSPIKQVSIPRLELCAALLLAKLMKSVMSSLQTIESQVRCIAWTDSKVVLAWLSSEPRKWKCFIGNRTADILSTLPRHVWHHVYSADNPADIASRGVLASELLTSTLWWNGPTWLQSNWEAYLHDEVSKNPSTDVTKELRPRFLDSYITTLDNHTLQDLFTKVSSLTKIFRIIARCLRWKRKKPQASDAWISTQELTTARNLCIKWAQLCAFEPEVKLLKDQKPISRSSILHNLVPFLDENNILRVRGRLENSTCSYQTKHPIILPKAHIFTTHLISYLHTLHLHAGVSLLLNIIRLKYWIVSARTMIKTHINQCITCIRHRARTSEQLMADLPQPRVSFGRAFDNVGVDYAGPVYLLRHKGRGAKRIKGYISLFTCLSTRALHLEVVSELTSNAFIACLKRFISRRGIPSNIYSDNGTNFVGANRQLNELFEQTSSKIHNSLVADYLSSQQVSWHFTPPASPHFGGSWESGVKLIKHHLRRVIGESSLTFEELSTLLCQIEALINSRPLVPMSSDINNFDVITPAHFLIGRPTVALPEESVETASLSTLNRWRLLQKLHQTFWRRWHVEYLTTLQQRPKWTSPSDNINIGDLVLVKEDNLPPSAWLLARVVSTHPGKDKLVRVVTVKTTRGEFKRPIVKLCKLPINCDC